MNKYYTTLTAQGTAKLSAAALSNNKVQLTEFAIGDGNGAFYSPTGNETVLKKEKWRGNISSINVDPSEQTHIKVECAVPHNVGGFTIREIGLYDDEGTLMAIGNYPDTPKTILTDGVLMDLLIYTVIKVANTAVIDMTIDPSFTIASRNYVHEQIEPVTQQLAQKANKIEMQTELNRKAEQAYVVAQLGTKRDTATKIKATDLDISADGNKIKLANLSDEVRQAMAGNTPINASVDDGAVVEEKIAPSAVTLTKLGNGVFNENYPFDSKSTYNNDSVFAENMKKLFKKVELYGANFNDTYYFSEIWGNVSGGRAISIKRASDNVVVARVFASFTGVHTSYFLSQQNNSGVSARVWIDAPSIGGEFSYFPSATSLIIDKRCMISRISTLPFSDDSILQPTNLGDDLVDVFKTVIKDIILYGAERKNNYYLDSIFKAHATNSVYAVFIANENGQIVSKFEIPNYTPTNNTTDVVTMIPQNNSNISGSVVIDWSKMANWMTYVTFGKRVKISSTCFSEDLSPINQSIDQLESTVNDISDDLTVITNKLDNIDLSDVEDIADLRDTVNSLTADVTSLTNTLNQIDLSSVAVNPFATLKWNGQGDSLTAWGGTSTSYMKYAKDVLGIGTIRNYGVSGTSIAYSAATAGNGECMARRYVNMDNDADIITVMGGTNDAANDVPIGTMTDRTDTTFYGALHVLLSGLIAKYPGKSIAVITPIQDQWSVQNNKLKNYVDAIKEVAAYYSLPVLDLYNGGGFPVRVSAFSSLYMADSTHPNNDGLRLLGRKRIAPFLRTF